MGFWDLKSIKLDDFRLDIWSKVESGANLNMAFMEIDSDKKALLMRTDSISVVWSPKDR